MPSINVQLYAAFVFATCILMLIPGPNVAFIVANSIAYGTRYGLLTVAGTSCAIGVQLALAGLGMAALGTIGSWFEWIRWVGVAYLVYLWIRHWFAEPTDFTKTQTQARSAKSMFLRAFVVSLTNPKTLLFYGAFFPQFIDTHGKPGGQVILLAVTFLILAILIDGAWAILAVRVRGVLAARGRLRNRLSGALLIGAAMVLALTCFAHKS
jgi:homoserine/homoserine lactone efflux protein